MFENFNQQQQTSNPSSELPTLQIPSAPNQEPYIPETPKPNRRKSVIIGIIIFAILIILVAGALVGYNYLTNKNKNTNVAANVNIEANGNMAINQNNNLNQNVNANINANANINQNINANVNLNSNANRNVNINANANGNINTGINVNGNVNNVNTAMIDSDNDGLTDEKELLYGTNPNNPDTDGDSFKDGAEIENIYSPNGTGRLNINDFKTYCQNNADDSFNNEELISICNSGAELYNPLLQLIIAGDETAVNERMDTLSDDIDAICNNLFSTNDDKNTTCALGMTLIFLSFGEVK